MTNSLAGDSRRDSDVPKRRGRGRIPQSDWPNILYRHMNGTTLSGIARDYGCTPSAIAYVVKKAEEAGMKPQSLLAAPKALVEQQEQQQAQVVEQPAPAPVKEAIQDNNPAPSFTPSSTGDEIEERLSESASVLLAAYHHWRLTGSADAETTDQLNDALHKMRRVLARIDIKVSSRESQKQTQKPIPLPRHRNAHEG